MTRRTRCGSVAPLAVLRATLRLSRRTANGRTRAGKLRQLHHLLRCQPVEGVLPWSPVQTRLHRTILHPPKTRHINRRGLLLSGRRLHRLRRLRRHRCLQRCRRNILRCRRRHLLHHQPHVLEACLPQLQQTMSRRQLALPRSRRSGYSLVSRRSGRCASTPPPMPPPWRASLISS